MRVSKLFGPAAAVAATLFVLSVGQKAHADILPSAGMPTVTDNGNGTFTWTYGVRVTDTQEVQEGDFFIFYDFVGFQSVGAVNATATPLGGTWTSSTSGSFGPVNGDNGTATPLPLDDPSLTDIKFTYSGPRLVGAQPLGTFSLISTLGEVNINRRDTFIGRGTDQDITDPGLTPGTLKNANATNYIAPGAVPEPGTYVTGAIMAGTTGLGLVRGRLRSRRKAA